MQLYIDERLKRVVRALPRGRVFTLVELLFLALLALQLARVLWSVLTPVTVYGDWRATRAVFPTGDARTGLFSAFDPFFRTAGAAEEKAVVTSLKLELYGTRVNEASGEGSAIIAGPDGVQQSYAVGEEVLPGVTLKEVAFDSVTLSRGGNPEKLYVDQSVPAPSVGGNMPSFAAADRTLDTSAPASSKGAADSEDAAEEEEPLTADAIRQGIGFQPRTEGGQVTGLVLSPKGNAAIFRQAGFRDGDIVTAVNGQKIRSASDLQSLSARLVPGARLSLTVERGAQSVPVALILGN